MSMQTTIISTQESGGGMPIIMIFVSILPVTELMVQ